MEIQIELCLQKHEIVIPTSIIVVQEFLLLYREIIDAQDFIELRMIHFVLLQQNGLYVCFITTKWLIHNSIKL